MSQSEVTDCQMELTLVLNNLQKENNYALHEHHYFETYL